MPQPPEPSYCHSSPTPTLSPAENTPPVCMMTPVITPVPGQVTPPQMFSCYSCCCDNTRTEGRLNRKASLRLTRGSPLWREARAETQVKNLKQKAERNTDYLLAHLLRAGAAHAVLNSPILISKQENAPQICTQASPIKPPSNPPKFTLSDILDCVNKTAKTGHLIREDLG